MIPGGLPWDPWLSRTGSSEPGYRVDHPMKIFAYRLDIPLLPSVSTIPEDRLCRSCGYKTGELDLWRWNGTQDRKNPFLKDLTWKPFEKQSFQSQSEPVSVVTPLECSLRLVISSRFLWSGSVFFPVAVERQYSVQASRSCVFDWSEAGAFILSVSDRGRSDWRWSLKPMVMVTTPEHTVRKYETKQNNH